MGQNSKTILMQLAVVLIVAIMVNQATSIRICNMDTNDMQVCRPAVTGTNPPPPLEQCCAVVRATDLECICSFKSYLPMIGIPPSTVASLIASCGITTVPRNCQG